MPLNPTLLQETLPERYALLPPDDIAAAIAAAKARLGSSAVILGDTAEPLDVEACWDDLVRTVGDSVVPVTYMNSAASLKSFVGQAGGAVCTSSNARAVFEWAGRQKPKLLFFPDEHLGRNTADV